MTQAAINYAKALYELSVPGQKVAAVQEILEKVPALSAALQSPVISHAVKERIIDRIFPKEVRSFLKIAVKNNNIDELDAIFMAYQSYAKAQKQVLTAVLSYVTPPDEQQQEELVAFLKNKYHTTGVELQMQQDAGLVGGFVLKVGNEEYDWSLKGRFTRLQQQLTGR